MIEVRCHKCNKLHLKCTIFVGAIQCPRCHMIFEYKILPNLNITEMYDKVETETNESIE